MKGIALLFFSTLLTCLVSCHSKSEGQKKILDTPSSGETTIGADGSLNSIISEELKTFHLSYPEAKIHIIYEPEQDIVSRLLENKIPLAIIPRQLSADEKNYFDQQQIPVQQIKMATDALAFIINRENPDSNLTFEQVTGILNGKITRWSEINASSPADSIILVFVNRRSSTIRYLQNEILKGAPMSSHAFAADSESMVKNYVEQNPKAIGVLDVSRISDVGETEVQSFLESIRVVSVSHRDSINNPIFYKPSRYNMLYGKYPFLREVYLVLREGHIGLGTGFANYVMNERGQLIIHHFGLVAAKQPVRVIELRNEF